MESDFVEAPSQMLEERGNTFRRAMQWAAASGAE
jgi:hypothetical protein